jgi:hypothetical protein
MLQVPTELPTLENILDTSYNNSVRIKINNWGTARFQNNSKEYDNERYDKQNTFVKTKTIISISKLITVTLLI